MATTSDDDVRYPRGYKVVCRDYTPCYGKKADLFYHVGTRHALPYEQAPVLCERGYHYCQRALDCLAFVPLVIDFDQSYRLLRVVDESPPGRCARFGLKVAASRLYIESEVTDVEERRGLLTGTTYDHLSGRPTRFVAGALSGFADFVLYH